jgi:hypothetical protein
MATGGEAELFEGLPELVSPERGGGRGGGRLRMAERRQVELRAISLEDLVPADHRVRLVWRFVEGLDLSGFQAAIKAVEGQPGHPLADPWWLCGCSRRSRASAAPVRWPACAMSTSPINGCAAASA